MDIILNGENRQVEDNLCVADLVEFLSLGDKRIALEVNEEIVPKSQHGKYQLQSGDKVEIVNAIGGG